MKQIWLGAILGAGLVAALFGAISDVTSRHDQSGPALTVVALPNGQQVTCIVVAGTSSCDWLGLRSDPKYKEAKP